MKTSAQKCTVCGSTNTESYVDYIDSTLCEDFLLCHECGYVYEFAYGATCVRVGVAEIIWGYQDTLENKLLSRQASDLTELARICWTKEKPDDR